jgi:hypothetical protein
MSLNLKRLSLANARLEILTRTEINLQAQCLELMKLREQFRTEQFSADLQSMARARKPASAVIAASVRHGRQPAAGYAFGAGASLRCPALEYPPHTFEQPFELYAVLLGELSNLAVLELQGFHRRDRAMRLCPLCAAA